MSIGQAYADILTPREQQALAEACDWLIDHAFDECVRIEKPQDVLDSVVGEYLPTRSSKNSLCALLPSPGSWLNQNICCFPALC
jgi:hypothetical protein